MMDEIAMDQKPSLDLVFLAVSALYNNPNTAEKEKASQWLGALQKSVSISTYFHQNKPTKSFNLT